MSICNQPHPQNFKLDEQSQGWSITMKVSWIKYSCNWGGGCVDKEAVSTEEHKRLATSWIIFYSEKQ